MKERIMLAVLGLIAMACVGVCAMMWSVMHQGRQVNEAMLAHLASLAPAVKPMETEAELPLEWSEVTLTLVKGEAGSEPVGGASISFNGRAFGIDKDDRIRLNQFTNEEGIARFGPVRPGQYELVLTSPNGYGYSTLVVLYPGQRKDVRIECPRALEFEFSADVKLPGDLMEQDLVFIFRVEERDRTFYIGQRKWRNIGGGDGRAPGRPRSDFILWSTKRGVLNADRVSAQNQTRLYPKQLPAVWHLGTYLVENVIGYKVAPDGEDESRERLVSLASRSLQEHAIVIDASGRAKEFVAIDLDEGYLEKLREKLAQQ